jgi:hypothetical protein
MTWTVTSQQETTAPNASNIYVDGVKVGFTTDTGVAGSVFVPNTAYNATSVKRLIQSRVDKMTEVQGLTNAKEEI